MGSHCLVGIDFQFFEMKIVLEVDGGDGCTTVRIYVIKASDDDKFYVFVFCHNFLKLKEKVNWGNLNRNGY